MKRYLPAAAIMAASLFHVARTPASSQSYPIDCAILLCLAGGWPPSAECSLARAEFIRRATPVPVEPPLQIWRCPLGGGASTRNTVIAPVPRSESSEALDLPRAASGTASGDQLGTVGLGADVDISAPAFAFVRSINVYDVRATQREHSSGECERSSTVRHGTYDIDGQFRWRRSSMMDVPPALRAHGYGEHCPWVGMRTVFVDWRDHKGVYRFEQVNF